MKKYLIIPLLLFPFISLASPLTQEQATALIQVVQSSPGTPASAFTNLITAFSNITVNQANSLITVVQSAPGVPANSFVGLLIAFTEDQPVPVPDPTAQKITELNQKVDTLQNQITQQNQLLGQIQQNTTPTPPPPPPPQIDKSEIVVMYTQVKQSYTPYPGFNFKISVLDKQGKYIEIAPWHWDWPEDDSDYIFFRKNYSNEEDWLKSNQKYEWENRFTNQSIGGIIYSVVNYFPTTPGIKTLTFTSGSLSKTVTIDVK